MTLRNHQSRQRPLSSDAIVKAGDWTHRVRIERRDQLGFLGEPLIT